MPGAPLTGRETPRPVTAYGRSKLAAEESVRGSRLGWSIIRPPIVYGPRDREVLKIFRLARLRLAPVFGDGSQELSAVHATDLAEAMVAVGQSTVTVGGTYLASHPEVFTSAELGHAVARAMGASVTTIRIPPSVGRALLWLTESGARLTRQVTILTTDKANEFFQPAWTGDPAPLTRDTGWHATYDLQRGLAHTYGVVPAGRMALRLAFSSRHRTRLGPTRSGLSIYCCSPTWPSFRWLQCSARPGHPSAGGSWLRTCWWWCSCIWSPGRALGPVGRTIREIYPLLLLPALYSELDILNSVPVAVHDPLVQQWELLLFGGQISRDWWQTAPSRFWSTLFHSAYLSYYLIISAPRCTLPGGVISKRSAASFSSSSPPS